jgi:cytochrome b pre-mRNA-processing protein 3
MRNKYLKDIYIQWRGLLAAYDEGVVKGDAVLASAIWRNLFKASEDVDIRKLAQITSYMRRLLHSVDSLPDHAIMAGQFKFSSPKDESNVVRLKSPMMDAPFQKGDDLSGKKGE